jgi:hypothetical protein
VVTLFHHLRVNKIVSFIIYLHFKYIFIKKQQVSLITKGSQMIPCLNSFDIKAACIGNHDFGIYSIKKLIKNLSLF